MLLEGIQGFAMAPGLPNIDNTPLDPGGQALGLVNPIGAYIGTPAETAPPALPKTNSIVPQNKSFLPSLGINPRKLFPPLSNRPSLQEAPKAPEKRLQEHSPNNAEKAPIKALISPAYQDMEQALLSHFTNSNSALYIKMAAIKTYIASLIVAIKQHLKGQLDAIKHHFLVLKTQQAPLSAPNHPLKPLSSEDNRQSPRQPLPPQGTTFAEVAYSPPTNPNRATKPTKSPRASPSISKPSHRAKPAEKPTGKPTTGPQ
jgi:hypothetical protein